MPCMIDRQPPDKAACDPRGTVPVDPPSGATLRYLAVAGLTLLALVVALEPDVGFAAPTAARALFWAAQIGVGLFVLQALLLGLTRLMGASRVPSWALVMVSGFLGAVLLSPIYWLLGEGLMEQWLGYPALPENEGAHPTAVIGRHVFVAEFIDIVGPVTAAWALICLPRLHWLMPPLLNSQTHSRPDGIPLGAAADRIEARAAVSGLKADCPKPDSIGETMPAGSPRPRWSDRLPAELGRDVIAVASELQYLRVWTTRGCGLILGALADVEAEESDHGLRVHRSWWVVGRHVVSVRRTGQGAVCLMSNGREVPVSRRRRADVLARFGDGARYVVAPSSETVADADLN